MVSTARMDELRKKFDENPRRYFAPLANEYRKVGDLEQAIFICQEYLPQQPGHMSGHIVYGQALFESGRQEEARAVFETALALDPENLIALRHLGDIATTSGDPAGARQWYQRVLEADPRNEEIAALIDSLPTPEGHTPATPAIPVESTSYSAGQQSQEQQVTDLSSSAVEAQDGRRPTTESGALDIEYASSFDSTNAHAGDEPTQASSQPAGFEKTLDLEISLPEMAPQERAADDAPKPTPGFGDIDLEQSAPAAHQTVADDGLLDLEDFAIPGSSTPVGLDAALPLSDPYGGVLGAPADQSASDATEFAEEPALPSAGPPAVPEAFVTETMAELYLRQGHVTEALNLYDRLMAQRPYDDALAARAAAARQQALGGPTIREFLIGIFHPTAAAGPTDGIGNGDGEGSVDALWAGGEDPAPDDERIASALARGFGGGIA